MSLTKLKYLIQSYENLTKRFPMILSAEVIKSNRNTMLFKASYGIYKIKDYSGYKLSKLFSFDPYSYTPITHHSPFPHIESDILFETLSPSRRYRATFKREGPKCLLEIWDDTHLLSSTNVHSAHGPIYNTPEFARRTITWSADEKKLVYLAEKKEEGYSTYTDPNATEAKLEKTLKKFDLKYDFGENYQNRGSSSIFIFNLLNNEISIVDGLPDDLIIMHVSFTSYNGDSLCFLGLKKDIAFRGIEAGFSKDYQVFHLKNYKTINLSNKARSPSSTNPELVKVSK